MQSVNKMQSHRRNKCQTQIRDYSRQSMPYGITESGRNSFANGYTIPYTFRCSDMTSFLPIKSSLFCNSTHYRKQSNPNSLSGRSTLITSLHQLQAKLLSAKNHLDIKLGNFSNSPLFKQETLQKFNSGEINKITYDDDKWEQSTINLESQQKLMTVAQGKEKMVWANKIKTYYISEVAKGFAGVNQRAKQHLSLSVDILKCSPLIQQTNKTQTAQSKLNLPRSSQSEGKQTLVIDLDETLIHCQMERINPDDIEIELEVDGFMVKAYVSIRPYAISFLKRAKKYFEIIAFTASEKSYADVILNEIDPEGTLIDHRLYRQHCIKLASSVYTKDLSMINRQLSSMILVDNSPLSYLYQVDNGVPILPYYHGQDTELLSLQKYLEKIRKQKDVRKLNRETFKLWRYNKFNDCDDLVQKLYQMDNGYY